MILCGFICNIFLTDGEGLVQVKVDTLTLTRLIQQPKALLLVCHAHRTSNTLGWNLQHDNFFIVPSYLFDKGLKEHFTKPQGQTTTRL